MPDFFGGRVFDAQQFKDTMNSHYYPLENMKKTVELLKSRDDIDLATIQYGQYQAILAPAAIKVKGHKFWLREMGFARMQLTAQANSTPLSKDEPTIIPLTRCALLDASIRKCFNSVPPIPMQIDVRQKTQDDPSPDQHSVDLVWEYGAGNVPTLLHFTMICPFKASL
jgi:hypothetical protein